MNTEAFNIYIDRLKDGVVEIISESLSPEFLGLKEDDILFIGEISLSGEAYTADNEFIMHLNVEANVQLPCRICDDPVKVPIVLKGLYIIEPIETIKSGIFCFKDPLRESILLEAPHFVKCGGETCLKSKMFEKYLKTESETLKNQDDDYYRPFENLNFKK